MNIQTTFLSKIFLFYCILHKHVIITDSFHWTLKRNDLKKKNSTQMCKFVYFDLKKNLFNHTETQFRMQHEFLEKIKSLIHQTFSSWVNLRNM